MKQSKRIFAVAMGLMFLITLNLQNCASSRSGSSEESNLPDAPEWFLVQPQAEDAIYGVGMAKKQNPSLARNTAIARARDDVAGQVEVKVSNMLKDFMQESGVGENAQALEFTQSVSKQVTDISLQGCQVLEVYPGRDGTFYALVEYPLDALRQSTLTEAQKEEALYNEFKAQQGFEALQQEIENLE